MIPYEIELTNAAAEYPWLADKIKNEGFTDVVICGGDGTINQVTSCLLGTDVNVGIIPGAPAMACIGSQNPKEYR
jgi:diacylglycerol kinase family enzyme